MINLEIWLFRLIMLNFTIHHYEKKRCFATTLQFNFWVTMTICNSLYSMLWVLLDKLHELQKLKFIIYTMQLVAIQLQFSWNNSFSTTMQFHHIYSHKIMLMLLFFFYPLKFDMWHNKFFCHMGENKEIKGTKVKVIFQILYMTHDISMLVCNLKLCILDT
jgi:hypothetical protein